MYHNNPKQVKKSVESHRTHDSLFHEDSHRAENLSEDFFEDEEAVRFLLHPDSFRPFSKGLTEAIVRAGYKGEPTAPKAKAVYLFERMHAVGSSVGIKTVTSWFDGSHQPKVEPGYRRHMFEICFALHFSYADVKWFFSHVYFDRCCNCHLIDEAVYYYCFLHGITYAKAREWIAVIENAPESIPESDEAAANYTRHVQRRLTDVQSDDEMVSYLISQKYRFHKWNQSAIASIQELTRELLGPEDTKETVDALKREAASKCRTGAGVRQRNMLSTKGLDRCGLIIREILFDARHEPAAESVCSYINDMIGGKKVFSDTFLISSITGGETGGAGAFTASDIPYVVKNNFPGKKTLSNVLNEAKAGTSKSYDAIRKVLVLLHFYRFWCKAKLMNRDSEEYQTIKEAGFAVYCEEAESWLQNAGYEPLYAGNPYDWMFLRAAASERPLQLFRDMVAGLAA